jgi:hypothetical protein
VRTASKPEHFVCAAIPFEVPVPAQATTAAAASR